MKVKKQIEKTPKTKRNAIISEIEECPSNASNGIGMR